MAKYGPKPKPMEDRFWEKVRKTRRCWLWTGTKNNMGYGTFMRVSPKKELAHRVAWYIAHGELPGAARVLHTCDNPACVRPDHLFLGTMRDNSQDMLAKGRNKYVAHPGEANGQAKLTEGQVREMREKYAAGGVTQAQLAKEYEISQALAHFVVTRKAWKHVI